LSVLVAQFGGPPPVSTAPDYRLLVVGLLALVVVVFAITRWRPRFSLRALLISLTVVAVLLGAIVFIARREPAGKRNALRIARQWVIDQGRDPATYKFFADPNDDGWQVFVEYQPPTPDAFTTLRMDSRGKITEVIAAP